MSGSRSLIRSNVEFDFLTNRDVEILELICEFGGKTFVDVLEKTLWYGRSSAKRQVQNRITILKDKYKIIRLVPTGLMSPRNAIALTENGARYINEYTDFKVPFFRPAFTTIYHTIYEQIAYYWLKKSGRNVSRTAVIEWRNENKHTPDLIYHHNQNISKPVYVEIELSRKENKRYTDIFANMESDGAYAVLYIFKDERSMKFGGHWLPLYDKIYITNIDFIVESISSDKKLKLFSQKEFLKKFPKKNKK